jgi:TatD DNase family protein
MNRTALLDAHIHRVHEPQTDYPATWTYLSCGTGPEDWFQVLEDQAANIHPYLGFHPEKFNELEEPFPLEKLENLLFNNPILGLGEIGLDRRYYSRFPRLEQEKLLRSQLSLAVRYDRPVILHQVRNLGTLLELLGTLPDQIPMLIHGFRGNLDQVRQIARQGLYISLGPGPFWENDSFKKAATSIPRNRILLESDWPYVKTSSTLSYIQTMENLYDIAAVTTGIDREELIRIVHSNGKVFTDRQVNRQRET